MRSIPAVALALALFSPPVGAAVLVVPDHFATIQSAIIAAANEDTVLVRPGTYVENLNYLGKGLTVMSEAGPAATIIDGSSPAHPDTGSVIIIPAASPTPVLDGFTVTGGTGTIGIRCPECRDGGGIAVLGPATIRGNWIAENEIANPGGELLTIGGGVAVWPPSSGTVIEENRIYSNTASSRLGARGGGVYAPCAVRNNQIFLNSVGDPSSEICVGSAGGVYGGIPLTGNVIACNVSVCLGGGVTSEGWVDHNTIVGNRAIREPEHSGVIGGVLRWNAITYNIGKGYDCDGSPPPGSCNNFFGNTIPDPTCYGGPSTNINLDPRYGESECDQSFCLLPDSPMLPENSPPGCGLIGASGLCGSAAVPDIDAPTSPDYASGPLRAHPNPFNPSTTLSFRLDRDSVIELDVHDAEGRLVARLHRGFLAAGEHSIEWDGRDTKGQLASSGVYVVTLRSPTTRLSQKLLLIK